MFLFGGPAKSASQKLAEEIAAKQAGHRNMPFSGGMSAGAAVTKAPAAPQNVNTPVLLSRGADHEARRAAAEKDTALAGHVLVDRRAGRGRSIVVKSVHLQLSEKAFALLDLIIRKHEAAGRRSVKVLASDAATELKFKLEDTRSAFAELRGAGLIVDVRDSYGVEKIMPSSLALGQ